jgi:hypothetical protein
MTARFPSPKNLLRIAVLTCLVGAFLAAMVAARGDVLSEAVQRLRQLSGFLFSSIFPFALFYIEYQVVQGLTQRELDLRWGYIQTVGCWAILLTGTLSLLSGAFVSGSLLLSSSLQERLFLYLCIFGQVVFLVNVVWSYMHELAPHAPRLRGDRPTATWGWPRSPARLFAIAAMVIAAIGLVSLAFGWPRISVPVVLYGEFSVLPAGDFLLVFALPFALFSLAYGAFEQRGREFPQFGIRIHFACTLVIVLELLRVYARWTMSLASRMADAVTFEDFRGTLTLVALSCVAFTWNVWRRSYRS